MTDDQFDLHAFLPFLLNQAAEVVSSGFQRAYRERYGMLRTEWRVMFHLARHGDMTATEIGRRAREHKTKVSRAVRALEEKRFLERRPVEADRRAETLALSRAGIAAFRDIASAAQAYEDQLWADFTTEERRILLRCLAHLADETALQAGR